MGLHHPCEECDVRRKRCIASGAYRACERCQKKRRHCSDMDAKAGKTTRPSTRQLEKAIKNDRSNTATAQPKNNIPLVLASRPLLRQRPKPDNAVFSSVAIPRIFRTSLLKKLLQHGAIETDLKTVKSQGYITVPKWLAIPGPYSSTSSVSGSMVNLPIALYSLHALHFLGFTQTSAAWYLHSLMAEIARLHRKNITIPPDFLIEYFSKTRLNEKIKGAHLDNRAVCEAAGLRSEVYDPLLSSQHKDALRTVAAITDWLVDIVRANARALLELSTTVKHNLRKTSSARSVVRGLMPRERSYEKKEQESCVVRRVVVAKLPDGRMRVYKIRDVERCGKKERVLKEWKEMGHLERRGLVGRYPLFVYYKLSFSEMERAAMAHEKLLNETCWAGGKMRVEIEVPMPDVASLRSTRMAPEEADRIVDGCRRRQLLVKWSKMHRE